MNSCKSQPDQPDAATLQKYVEKMQRLHNEELGFLPSCAIREYVERDQVLPATENGELCSYALYFDGRNGKRPRLHPSTLKIHQICTQYDARFLHHATTLINRILAVATDKNFRTIQAWVATDIDANDFWSAVGFTCVAQRIGGKKRGRIHNLWELTLVNDSHPAEPIPATRTPDGIE